MIWVQIRQHIYGDSEGSDIILHCKVWLDGEETVNQKTLIENPGYKPSARLQRLGITKFDSLLEAHPNKANICKTLYSK